MNKIEIPFGAKDSELCGWEYTIPEGMEAVVEGGKVIVRKKESEDERIRKELMEFLREAYSRCNAPDGCAKWLVWLDRQKEQPMSAEEVLIRAGLKPYRDGNQWCVLAGGDIQEGICGFGDTIDEALYQFLMEVLKIQKEQKPAEWSEEDERAIDRACVALRAYSNGDLPEFLPSELLNYADRLQSLRPQPKQELSEEEQQIIEDAACAILRFSDTVETKQEEEELCKLASKLQDLKPKSHWWPQQISDNVS